VEVVLEAKTDGIGTLVELRRLSEYSP
jgi:hypothetical protein